MILDENLFETTLGDTIADSDQEQALERVEDSVDNKRQIEKFKKYMLPETILNYLYDYKYSDIASVLGISETRVRDHVRKNISEFVKNLLKNKKEVMASDIDISTRRDMIRIIFINLYGRSAKSDYEIIPVDEKINSNGFQFRDFRIIRRVK